ncbi:MAG TPA: ABC transporter permease [Spirochaetales bacterium]|nr:ABC transporter permease [Spirochaetales bacterium]HRY53250.1 ABC transporter permease [Spirochaetia bacterium]HRZ65167.1 ABC transporter permease [Spirochaetia bacterium]
MLRYLLEKEFKQILRNKMLPRFILLFPCMALLVFPLAANFEVRHLSLGIVDCDRSPYSSRLARKLAASTLFRLEELSSDYAKALKEIELDRADIVLEIPAGFERRLVEGEPVELMISANSVNGAKGGLGSAYLGSLVSDFSSELRSELGNSPAGNLAPSFSILTLYRYNPRLEYPVYMVPALMVMLLAMLCGFLPALNIVGEKESGTIEQMNVTPVRRLPFILSKLIPYWVIGFIALTICFGVARLVYGLAPEGSFLVIYLFASVFVLALSGFGLVISNYAKTIQQAMFMMFFFVITFVLMSGLYTPVASMPDWAQAVSRLFPLRYFMAVMRLVYLKGSGLGDLLVPLAALLGFAAFFNGWAVLSYRKKS